jgi:hypothetical protein
LGGGGLHEDPAATDDCSRSQASPPPCRSIPDTLPQPQTLTVVAVALLQTRRLQRRMKTPRPVVDLPPCRCLPDLYRLISVGRCWSVLVGGGRCWSVLVGVVNSSPPLHVTHTPADALQASRRRCWKCNATLSVCA